jgi:hypothetical protein
MQKIVVSNISKQQQADKLDLGASEQQCMCFFVYGVSALLKKKTAHQSKQQ